MISLVSPLRTRNFRVLWIGQTISLMGDRIFPIALATLVLNSGDGAAGLGLVLAARSIALVVVVLPAGLLADRIRRTHVMIAADLLCMCGVIGLAASHYPISVILACACASAVGAGEGIFVPAFNAVIPQVLQGEDVQKGNALMSLSSKTAMIAGPVIGGILITLGSMRAAFVVDGLTFVVSLGCLVTIRLQRPITRKERITLRVAAAGLTEIRRRSWVTAVMAMSSIQMFFASAAWTLLLPVVSHSRLGGTTAYGALLALFGVGAVLGALLAGLWRPSRPGAAALMALYPFGAMLVTMAISRSVIVIGAMSVLAGAGLEFFGITWLTALQRDIPKGSLARVMSVDYFISGLLYPIGLAAMGPLAERFGTSAVLLLGAGALALSTIYPLLVPGGFEFASPGPEVEVGEPGHVVGRSDG